MFFPHGMRSSQVFFIETPPFFPFFNFLKKRKGYSAHLTATAWPHTVPFLGVTGIALTSSQGWPGALSLPYTHFWWLKPHQPRTLLGNFRKVFCPSPEPAELAPTQTSLPPEPALLTLSSLPAPPAAAVGRRMAWEPCGHGGLNRSSVKAGSGAWGVPKTV